MKIVQRCRGEEATQRFLYSRAYFTVILGFHPGKPIGKCVCKEPPGP